MVKPVHKYLKAEDIRTLSRYRFSPRLLVEGHFAGRHQARARGSSTEFRDYRPYVIGDDLKMVDWRIYARTDRHYLKTYEQETNTRCYIFLDSSASMGFGRNMTKLDYASYFTAALSYLVARSSDQVSLTLFDDRIRSFFPPSGTAGHIQTILCALEDNKPGNQTALADTLTRSFPLLAQKGTLVIISDFLEDPGRVFAALSPYLHRGFAIHLFHVLAPEEIQLDDRGLTAFRDLETRQRVIAHTDHIRQAYDEAMSQHIHALRDLATRRRMDYMLARTDSHYLSLFDHLTQ